MATTPVLVRNARDTHDNQLAPSVNYSKIERVVLRGNSGQSIYAYLYFSRPFPLGVTVLSATLRLYQADAFPASRTIIAKRITASWDVSRLNFNNRPAVTTTGQNSVTKAASPAGTEWAFNVQPIMQAVADGAAWWGIRLELTTAASARFWSTEYAANPALIPTLEVSWSDAPDAPSTLAPSANRAVSVAKPVLRFDFTDVSGDTSLQAVQVQINPTDVWTAPAFDSGVVATSEPQLDLNTTAYAGLANGASTFWRVRVQDGAGLWSAWSTSAQFRRVNKGVLTITNPAVAPNNFVEEPTPPIAWTFTGATQQAYQVAISKTSDPWNYLWVANKKTATDTSITPPSGIITENGTSYRLSVYIQDTVQRESTPGDDVTVVDRRDFTYNLTGTVTAVPTLTVTGQSPYPWAQLDWTRATAPDSFVIVRDGKVIRDNIAPADVLVSGTSYRFVDRTAHPRRNTVWEVRAVVNGKTSSGNATATRRLEPIGIWLSDEARSLNVGIMGRDGHADFDAEMVEAGENINVLGSSIPRRITQALGGYQGTVSGALVSDAPASGVTAQQARDVLMELKRYAGRPRWLTLGDMTIKVVIHNVSVVPSPHPDVDFDVSFAFFQTDQLFTAVM